MFDKIKGAAKTVKDTVGGMVGGSLEAVQGQLQEISEAAPALEQVGYRLAEIEVDVTIPPRLVVHLTRDAEVTDEAFQAVLANNSDKYTLRILLNLLRQANGLVGKVQIKGRPLRGVEVRLGLPPGLTLKYA